MAFTTGILMVRSLMSPVCAPADALATANRATRTDRMDFPRTGLDMDVSPSLPRRLALVRHRGHRRADRRGVAEVVMPQRLQVAVELVDERLAGWDVETYDLLIGDVVEILDQRPQAVAVRGDDHALPGAHGRRDHAVPVRQKAGDGVLEAFGARELIARDVGIPGVVHLEPRIVGIERRRRRVVRAAPDEHLLLAELLGHLRLVEAL